VANIRTYTNLEIAVLADCFEKEITTIQRWIKENNPILTCDDARKCYKAAAYLKNQLNLTLPNFKP
jgi:hypothetical protein